ncbi:MAG: hypothetical protein JXA33_26130 [Anaerolineae bacterium]|nr:hypothetical protein [Anaerolineae bacterium]
MKSHAIKSRLRFFLILILATLLMTASRWTWFYRGAYSPPEIAEIDVSAVEAQLIAYQPVADVPVAGDGYVILDLSHTNNLNINDLAPLRDRLEDRGARVEVYDGTDGALADLLYRVTAWIIIAPTESYESVDREPLVAFVEDGGRLLMAADPTRPLQQEDEDTSSLYDIFFPTSAVPAINSIANAFGVLYFDDYLYNLTENEGNYRNVKFTHFAEDHFLTQDVETVVLFAAHSLHSDGEAIIIGDAETRSPVRTGEAELAAAVLTTEERVLALGDVTFLTAPYHTVGDNDRFLSHIADWLAEDSRQRDALEDFPYLFTQPVDLVQVSGSYLDPQLIVRSGELRATFEEAGLTLNLRSEVGAGHDALYVGVFEDLALVEDVLLEAGVTLTTPLEIHALEVTPTPTATLEVKEDEAGKEGETEEVEQPMAITIASLGTLGLQGTTLYVLDRSATRMTLVVLAEDAATVAHALERLTTHNMEECAQVDGVTVCSTGEAQDGLEGEEEPENGDTSEAESPDEPVSEPEEGAEGRIFIFSGDDGPDGARTSAADFAAILEDMYTVTLWSASEDGLPSTDDLAGYNVYIIDSGDYAFDEDGSSAFLTASNVESGGILLVGAQPLPGLEEDYAPLYDLEVAGTESMLLEGLTPGEIIELSDSENDVPALIVPEDEDIEVLLMRGPDSPQTGTPVIVATEDEGEGVNRLIIAALAFYRLPEDVQRTLTMNAVSWLMREAESE